MTLLRVYIDEQKKDYETAVSILKNTLEKINQKGIILDSDQEELIIHAVGHFNEDAISIKEFQELLAGLFRDFSKNQKGDK